MTYIVPSDNVGATICLEEKPEGVVVIPPELERAFMDTESILYSTFSNDVSREDNPAFLRYFHLGTMKTVCYLHFRGDCIEAVFPAEFTEVLDERDPFEQKDTQHGESSAVVRITDDPCDFRRVLMPIAVHLLNRCRTKTDTKADVEINGRHFEPISVDGISFDDVMGLDEVKDEIYRRMMLPFQRPEVFGKYGISAGGGILLYGPPGNGKTLIAKAVASELNLPFFSVSRSDLVDPFVGITEKSVRNLFRDMGKYPAAVLFIDECESLFPMRGNKNAPWESAMTDEFLVAMDGVRRSGGRILFIGATNMPWLVDQAMVRPGRLDVPIYVGVPGYEDRRRLLEMLIGKVPHEKRIDTAELAEMSEGWSFAEIRGLVDLAKSLRAEAEIKKTDRHKVLLHRDLKAAFMKINDRMPRKSDKTEEKSSDIPVTDEGQEYVADKEVKLTGYI